LEDDSDFFLFYLHTGVSGMTYLLLISLAYLSGSLSTAVLVSRAFDLPDPRQQGSGNPGATNVLRLGGKKAAALTLLGDALKGFIPVMLAQLMGMNGLVVGLVGLAAFLGHLYPVFFGFRGGKGVATALGVLSGFFWGLGLAVLATWIAVAGLTRYSSLAALVAAALSPLYVWLMLGHLALTILTLALAALLFWRHRPNIERLLRGEESRIGRKG
jgi:glycerol-3-phosphate acyltransferase PlsY